MRQTMKGINGKPLNTPICEMDLKGTNMICNACKVIQELPKCLILASLLTQDWSLMSEVCEDLDARVNTVHKWAGRAKEYGIIIDMEDGKIRLSFGTSIGHVRSAIFFYEKPTVMRDI